MKQVRITLPEGRADVHDGVGGIHKQGQMVELPDEVADQFVAMRLAVFLDDSSRIEAERANKARADDSRIAQQRARAVQSMSVHDALPAEVRHVVHEEGDEATEDYLARLASKLHEGDMPPEGLPPKRPRGRPRKQTPEGGDV